MGNQASKKTPKHHNELKGPWTLDSWRHAVLNPAVLLNVIFSVIEMTLLATQEGQFGIKNTLLVVLLEFIKIVVTTGIIVLLWKLRLYVAAYVIALLPFILIIPVAIMMVSRSGDIRGQ